MTNDQFLNPQLAALLSIDPAAIMEVKINDTYIEVITYEFKRFGLPLPLPSVTTQAPPTPDRVTMPTRPDDLTLLNGIGPVTAERLAASGIDTFSKLAREETAVIKAITNAHPSQIKKWQAEAATYEDTEL